MTSRNTFSFLLRLLILLGMIGSTLSASALSSLGTDFVGSTTNADFIFNQNNTERMRITTGGYVKIATAGGYLDYRPNNVACTAAQVLAWSGTISAWVCSNDSVGISGTGLTTNYVTKWNGTAVANSQVFDDGTNVGIGTSTGASKLTVAGSAVVTGDMTVQGKVITDTIVNRTVANLTISGSLFPDAASPLIYRDIGNDTTQSWNNLYLSGQIKIKSGTLKKGYVLVSDASGLATWDSNGRCTSPG